MGIMPQDWVWMAHPAHFIGAFDCRFHLATKVGDYIISTVGEYFPDEPVREIIAKCRDVTLKGQGDDRRNSFLKQIGYDEIGFGRTYETMVFKAVPGVTKCCPFIIDLPELDIMPYNDPDSAYEGHMKLCEKWADK